jgi:uncharacterized protein YaiI (UPF0178 family)
VYRHFVNTATFQPYAAPMNERIWVDADACPRVIKDMLYRVADRAAIEVVLVANQALSTPGSRYIRSLQVAGGFDEADKYIAAQAQPGDLVITADIPLAAELVANGVRVLSPRGERFTPENVRQKLNMRDFMDTMRASGADTGGPPPFSQADRKAFADRLDRIVARWGKPDA